MEIMLVILFAMGIIGIFLREEQKYILEQDNKSESNKIDLNNIQIANDVYLLSLIILLIISYSVIIF